LELKFSSSTALPDPSLLFSYTRPFVCLVLTDNRIEPQGYVKSIVILLKVTPVWQISRSSAEHRHLLSYQARLSLRFLKSLKRISKQSVMPIRLSIFHHIFFLSNNRKKTGDEELRKEKREIVKNKATETRSL
jgi:hypothetical protein